MTKSLTLCIYCSRCRLVVVKSGRARSNNGMNPTRDVLSINWSVLVAEVRASDRIVLDPRERVMRPVGRLSVDRQSQGHRC